MKYAMSRGGQKKPGFSRSLSSSADYLSSLSLHLLLFVCFIFPTGGVKWKDAKMKYFQNLMSLSAKKLRR